MIAFDFRNIGAAQKDDTNHKKCERGKELLLNLKLREKKGVRRVT